ncbi:MAG: hypothetical protein JO089_03140 [Alphaproteobacteria bacterium]|nr:hypothetical protein [Alphaproteobacteria bacterium]
MTPQQNAELMAQLSQQAVFLMGISFILGSLCTIFILLIFEMVRRARAEMAEAAEENAPDPRE